jgi:aerobic C4-dicarboxylate transport protein
MGRDKTRFLYLAVIVAVAAGVASACSGPARQGAQAARHGFVNLIKMMISPIIFCTIVLGIGSIRQARPRRPGRRPGPGYFLVMSTVALAIGLVVGNIIQPGAGLNLRRHHDVQGRAAGGHRRLPAAHHPDDALLRADQRLGAADAAGGAAGRLRAAGDGTRGEPVLRGIGHLQRLVFRVLAMIMWAAPIGASAPSPRSSARPVEGAGRPGPDHARLLPHLRDLRVWSCFAAAVVSPAEPVSLLRYLGREFLLILSTSSSESALPRLIAKMEHLGVSRPVVGITSRPGTRSTSTAPRST